MVKQKKEASHSMKKPSSHSSRCLQKRDHFQSAGHQWSSTQAAALVVEIQVSGDVRHACNHWQLTNYGLHRGQRKGSERHAACLPALEQWLQVRTKQLIRCEASAVRPTAVELE
jgi:hypothetical protein